MFPREHLKRAANLIEEDFVHQCTRKVFFLEQNIGKIRGLLVAGARTGELSGDRCDAFRWAFVLHKRGYV
jgi:hypothetical protein